jgi:mono/diheme cytochrome c family protein
MQLIRGVPGSAMPYFTIFDRNKLDLLLDYLENQFHITASVATSGDANDLAAAQKVFAQTCTTCHGPQGRVSDFGRGLRPGPPDLSRFSLTPDRIFQVITHGYTGTVMQPFGQLPKATRRGLMDKVIKLRQNTKSNEAG